MAKNTAVLTKTEKQLRTNRISYIFEAALEYFIDIMIKTTFITALLMNLGVSQGNAGRITSFASFAFIAQFFSVMFINPGNHVKKMSTVIHLINQLMFVFMYVMPIVNMPSSMKILVVAGLYLIGNLLHYTVFPFKFDWMMSYVEDKKRGVFSANKEIVSLLGGIIFSNSMGMVIDHFKEIGQEEVGFVISAFTILVLCILHLVTLLIVRDPIGYHGIDYGHQKAMGVRDIFGITIFDKKFSKIVILDILWHIGTGISTAFFAIYAQESMEIKVLTITVITACSSLLRVLVSELFGKIADNTSWANMLSISFCIGALAFLVFSFANPGNCFDIKVFGMELRLNIFHILYLLLHAVFMAGSNSGMTNITFDYVSHENRRYALGIKSAIGGLIAFLVTFIVGFFVDAYPNGVFKLFGMPIYTQQILSFGTFVVFIIIVIYIKKVIMKMKVAQ